MNNSLVDITGRVLPPEKIRTHNIGHVLDGGSDADWTRHLRNLPMFTCIKIKRWVILAPKDCCAFINPFVQSLERAARGMSFSLPQPIM